MVTIQNELAVWVQTLMAAIAAARTKALAALTESKATKPEKPIVQMTEEMEAFDRKYRRAKQVADRAEEAKAKWRDKLIAAVGNREAVIVSREKKIGTVMQVQQSRVDWKRFEIDYPEVALLIKTSYQAPPKPDDGWQYRAH